MQLSAVERWNKLCRGSNAFQSAEQNVLIDSSSELSLNSFKPTHVGAETIAFSPSALAERNYFNFHQTPANANTTGHGKAQRCDALRLP